MNQPATSAADDMRTRWLPTPAAVRHARALLAAEPDAEMAVIPMYQPGKRHGWWEVGQEVVTVAGVVFLGVSAFEPPADSPVPSYSWARHAATELAEAQLGDRPGTVAYAVVSAPDGDVSVFEY
jgi:hypothetical protein